MSFSKRLESLGQLYQNLCERLRLRKLRTMSTIYIFDDPFNTCPIEQHLLYLKRHTTILRSPDKRHTTLILITIPSGTRTRRSKSSQALGHRRHGRRFSHILIRHISVQRRDAIIAAENVCLSLRNITSASVHQVEREVRTSALICGGNSPPNPLLMELPSPPFAKSAARYTCPRTAVFFP